MTPSQRFAPAAQVAEEGLAASRSNGGCIVIVHETSQVEARFANNTSTTNGYRRERHISAVSIRSTRQGKSVGVASRRGAVDIVDLVRASEANAADAPPADDAAPLLDPSAGATPDFAAEPALTGMGILESSLGHLSGAFDEARGAGHVLSGFVWHSLETSYLGTSTGIRLRHEQPTGSIELVGRSPDGTRSAWTSTGTRWFEDVDLLAMHQRVQSRLGWAERRVDLPAGRYEALLPPDAVADLVIPLYHAMSGRDAEDGRSVFSAPNGGTKLGAEISSSPFELRSDPSEPGLECVPFVVAGASGTDSSVFDNGLSIDRTVWLDGGRLSALRYHRAGAARTQVAPAPPVDNLILELPGADGTIEDLVGTTQRGLLLTCLWYIREVDPVTLLQTGLTRDGVYLVEGGEVVGAVNNFRFNESPVEMLAHAIEAGRTKRAISREWNESLNRTAMPPLRVAEFNMTSVSPAN